MSDLLKSFSKITGTDSVEKSGSIGDLVDYVDTGSFTLNALISGSLFGGYPTNKITGISGKNSVGKSFLALAGTREFLNKHPDNVVVYFDSEAAITSEQLEQMGIDVNRISIVPVATIEEFRTNCYKILETYRENRGDEGFTDTRLMIVLDSLGNLTSMKELGDIAEGNEKVDMTKAKLLKAAFRVITLKSAAVNVPILINNHVYDSQTMYGGSVQSGGSGLPYAASIIIKLSKSRLKDGTDVVGAIITAKTDKSRLTKEQKTVQIKISFKTGLDRYYGLVDLAIQYGVFKKNGKRFEVPGFDTPLWRKTIEAEPEKYFTDDILKLIDKYVAEDFKYQHELEIPEVEYDIDGEE